MVIGITARKAFRFSPGRWSSSISLPFSPIFRQALLPAKTNTPLTGLPPNSPSNSRRE